MTGSGFDQAFINFKLSQWDVRWEVETRPILSTTSPGLPALRTGNRRTLELDQ